MRKGKMLFWVILLTMGTMILVSCSLRWLAKPSWEAPKVVAVNGADAWSVWQGDSNLVYAPLKQGQPTHLLLRDRDVVFAHEPKKETPFVYLDTDGLTLSVTYNGLGTEINGNTVSLFLEKDEAWEWLEKAPPEDLSALRLIAIGGEIGERRLESLKRLSRVNPNVGLWTESKVLQLILPLFDPSVVFLFLFEGQMVGHEIPAVLSDKKHIRTLHLDGRLLKGGMDFLSKMPALETLAIDGWDPSISGPLPEDLNNLRSIILTDPKGKNLASLGKKPHLDKLRLQKNCPLESLDGLSNFSGLKELDLFRCKEINELSPLKQLKQLKWLGLPLATTQEQLETIVRDHPNLVGLELLEADKVTDLNALKELRSLKYLLVNTPNAKPDPLFGMKGLRWLAVTIKDNNEELLVKIQQALPETSVVRASPVCLGSGWILLLAPGVLFACWVEKRRRRAAQRGCRL